MSAVRIRRACPKCGQPMRIVDGSQRSTRTSIYYVMECPYCLLRFDGCRPKRAKRATE